MKYGKRDNRRGTVRKKSLKTEWILLWILTGLLVVAVLLFIRSRGSHTSGNQGAGEIMSAEALPFSDELPNETGDKRKGRGTTGRERFLSRNRLI